MSTALVDSPATTLPPWGEDDVAEERTSALALLSPLDEEDKEQDAQPDDRRIFDELADELAYATRGLSSTRLACRHPAYAEIMAMGERTIPWLVERLETPSDRPIWLRLLGSLTRFQPGAGRDTIPEAAAAWIRWGKQQHNAR
jgi:hypothetical protein